MRLALALVLLAMGTPAHAPSTIPVVPCDTDSDCMAKNPNIPFGLD